MSTYNGRRAPNVSQYIANLNTVPSAADLAAQQEFGNFDDDLTLFTNTQFFDFDVNEPVGDIPFSDAQQPSPSSMAPGMEKPIAFGNRKPIVNRLDQHLRLTRPDNNYQFSDFSFPQSRAPTLPRSPPNGLALPPSPPNGLNFPGQHPQMPQQHSAYPSPQTGEKRKSIAASISSPSDDLEEHGRMAADEDKRRRNTAASARFRVKKKQREQALEKTAKEMTDKVQILEARVGQLEMENKWLKGLITEKNLKAPSAPSDSSEVKDADRITESSKKGVGTENKADSAVEA